MIIAYYIFLDHFLLFSIIYFKYKKKSVERNEVNVSNKTNSHQNANSNGNVNGQFDKPFDSTHNINNLPGNSQTNNFAINTTENIMNINNQTTLSVGGEGKYR